MASALGRKCGCWIAGCTWCSCWLMNGWLQLLPLWLCSPRVHLRTCLELLRPMLMVCASTTVGWWCYQGVCHLVASNVALWWQEYEHVSLLAKWCHWDDCYYYYCYHIVKLYLDNDWQTVSLQATSTGSQFLKTTDGLSVIVYACTVASIVDSWNTFSAVTLAWHNTTHQATELQQSLKILQRK